MPQLRYFTAGESHGQCLIGVVEGLPAGLKLDRAAINRDLARRQQGYGRGGRMKIEADEAEIVSGVRHDETIGSPVTLMVKNRDFKINELPAVTKPRPGHADLAGVIKYDRQDARDILERSSARETTMRVAIGGVCKLLLAEVGVDIVGHIVSLGTVQAKTDGLTFAQIRERSEASEVRCADPEAEKKMIEAIDIAKGQGDTIGGVFEVIAVGVPIGLGSHVHWDRKLDANLARALMSIQAMKGVEVGLGFEAARRFGSQVHDEILPAQDGVFTRAGNNAGGFEGGMTNGQPVVVRVAMKPLSTLMKPMRSVDIQTGQEVKATVERSDVCATPAAAVIGEAVVAVELAKALLDKFGGDSVRELKRNVESYREACQRW
ncbi:MAG TPA: chorismate synthase [Verrucomicrobiae bacterium]|nr:chorismate synthase [Verrucomicrobiae bacterium]